MSVLVVYGFLVNIYLANLQFFGYGAAKCRVLLATFYQLLSTAFGAYYRDPNINGCHWVNVLREDFRLSLILVFLEPIWK